MLGESIMAVRMGTVGNDSLTGTTGADYISGGRGNDTLDGDAGNDYIYGGEGNDGISDGAGADRLFGQAGRDVFDMDLSGGIDIVDGGWDVDVVVYGQPTGVTRVDFLDNSANSGAAAGDRFISVEGYQGGRATDIVKGSHDRNWFFASLGNDQYYGRGGADVYRAWQTQNPTVTEKLEIAFGSRAAILAGLVGIAPPPASAAVAFYEVWTDANNNQTRDSGEVIRQADVLDSIEVFAGTDGADKITGSDADEGFAPNGGADRINGGGGFDTLTYETLGAAGNHPNEPFVNVDLAARTAVQTIYNPVTFAYDTITTTVTNIEHVLGSAYNDQLAGNSLANILAGGDGSDGLDGRGGRDSLFGGNGDDLLVGGGDIDILDGGKGADLMDGGDGIDIADYSRAETSIAVSLLTGQGLMPIIDNVQVPTAESIGDMLLNMERVVGSLHADVISGDDAANVLEGRKGNDLLLGCGGVDTIYGETDAASDVPEYVGDPDYTDGSILDDCGCEEDEPTDSEAAKNYSDTIDGGAGGDFLYGQLGDDDIRGGTGNDQLFGGEGADILNGDADNDLLDGGLGTDFLYGGSGNDTISGGAGFDIIFGGSGRDTVDYSASTGAVTVNLQEFWKNSGGDAASDLITEMMTNLSNGEDPSAILTSALFLSLMQTLGSTGTETGFTLSIPDVILGVEGIVGSNFADTLTGDAASNTLNGGGGDDVIDGGAGNDLMIGGVGDDHFFVDSARDRITETATGGFDSVDSSVSYTLSGHVETLTLTGTAAINATGNAQNNILNGNSAANALLGGAGADRMNGFDGNDLYYVDNVGDIVTETSASGGSDVVRTTINYTLGANLESLQIIGTAAVNGTGNSLANSLFGNAAANILSGLLGNDSLIGGAGDDRLIGGAGNDSLTGGAGLDRFVFDSALSASTNVDLISDFSVADDTMVLVQSIFAGLATGTLSAAAFQLGTAANDAGDRIIYDQATGRVFYDADGLGGGAAIQFAKVAGGTALTNADFVVATSATAAASLSAAASAEKSPVAAHVEISGHDPLRPSDMIDWHAFDFLL